ncbi:MAG: hypothetical protein QM733_13365 [Ilumatobacteraceae bacterium]
MRVTLPLVVPGVASSLLLLFIIIFREFPLASFIATPGTNVVAVQLLNFQQNGRWPAAAALSFLISIVSAVAIALSVVITERVRISGSRARRRGRDTSRAAASPAPTYSL